MGTSTRRSFDLTKNKVSVLAYRGGINPCTAGAGEIYQILLGAQNQFGRFAAQR